MKIYFNLVKGKKDKKNLYKYIFTLIFTFVLVLTVPGSFNKVYAAPLEDCDLDGFDDATGVPVPWPGYDETKGDTPDGPAGSKATPTTAPANTTAGSKDNVTPSKSNTSNTEKTDSTKAITNNGNTNTSSSTKSNTSDSSKTTGSTKGDTTSADTTKTSSNASSNTKSSATDKSSKSDSDKTSSAVKNNTTKTESNKDSNTTSANTSNNLSDKSSGTTDGGIKTEASLNTTSNVSGESKVDNTTVGTEENSQGETTQGEEQLAEVSSDNGEVETVDTADDDAGNDEVGNNGIVDDFEAVINTKGTIAITEATGSIVHVGSSVNILGAGFAGNVENLEIQIHSEAKQLGVVNSSADGSFEAQLSIPADLAAGTHNIVVLYEGTEITRQQIEIGPKAADSFIQALTVGFTRDNKGLVPGVLILLGLLVVGVGSIGVNAIIRPKQIKR